MVKIMIIDDEVEKPSVKKKYEESLQGFELCFAANGAAAIQFLRKEKKSKDRPKLIILDQQFTYDCVNADEMIAEDWWKVLPYNAVDEEVRKSKEVLLSDIGTLHNNITVNQGLIIIKALKYEMSNYKISETPILFCSSQTDDTDTIVKAIDLGAVDHVSKDSFSDLSEIVGNILVVEIYSGGELAEKLLDRYSKDKSIIFQRPARNYLVKKCGTLSANEMEEIVRLLCGNIALATEQAKYSVTLNIAKKAFEKATDPQGSAQAKKKICDELADAINGYFSSQKNMSAAEFHPLFNQMLGYYLPNENFEGCYLNCGRILELIAVSVGGARQHGESYSGKFRHCLDTGLAKKCLDLYSVRSEYIHSANVTRPTYNETRVLIQELFAVVKGFFKHKDGR